MKDENNLELEKYKDIMVATIDYEIKRNSSILERNELMNFIDHHESFKQAISSDYKIRGLKKLKKTLEGFTVLFKLQGDLEYGQYIKASTGHDFDLFGNILERIQKIIEKRIIKNKKENLDVIAMIALSRKTSTNNWLLATLKNLSHAFLISRRKLGTDNITSINHIFEINSPNKLRHLEIYETNDTSTQVSVHLEDNATASIYCVHGVTLGLKVSWKDNNNLLIETKKNYLVYFASKQINIKGIVIEIDYVEI